MQLTLPIKPPTTESAAPSPPPRQRTLMIVDDDEGPRASIRMVFAADYRVLAAEDGIQALEIARTEKIDVAILDQRMPGMSGLELFAKLKELDPTVEVIILTAYETVENVRQALRLGACDYLSKPFDVATIRAAVSGAMERHYQVTRLRALESSIRQQQLAEEMVQTRSEIYASVLHDINGPLSSISCIATIIMQSFEGAEKLEGEDLGEIKNHLLSVARHANHCVQISGRYVSFLRRESPADDEVKVNEILSDVGHLLKFHPQTRNDRLLVQPIAGDWLVRINGIDLLQILLNLIINGLECSPAERPVSVSAKILRQPLDSAAFAGEGSRCRFDPARFHNTPPLIGISVQDQGPGIPSSMLARVFEPSFSAKPGGDGGGLGLSIVRRCIEASAAALAVDSRAGAGTTFTVFLPAHEVAAQS